LNDNRKAKRIHVFYGHAQFVPRELSDKRSDNFSDVFQFLQRLVQFRPCKSVDHQNQQWGKDPSYFAPAKAMSRMDLGWRQSDSEKMWLARQLRPKASRHKAG